MGLKKDAPPGHRLAVRGMLVELKYPRDLSPEPETAFGWGFFLLDEGQELPVWLSGATLRVAGRGVPGIPLELPGVLHLVVEDHHQHGLGLKVVPPGFRPEDVQRPDGAFRFLERLPNVGPARAKKIYDYFGEDAILDVLEGGIVEDLFGGPVRDLLEEVPGISTGIAQGIRAAWEQVKEFGSPEDLKFLASKGLSPNEVDLLMNAFRRDAKDSSVREVVPELLWRLYPNKGFAQVDSIRRKLDLDQYSEGRVHAAVREAMKRVSDDKGSTLLSLAQVTREARCVSGLERSVVVAGLEGLAAEEVVVFVAGAGDDRSVMLSAHHEAEVDLFRWARGVL